MTSHLSCTIVSHYIATTVKKTKHRHSANLKAIRWTKCAALYHVTSVNSFNYALDSSTRVLFAVCFAV